jgi:hypothetical protein
MAWSLATAKKEMLRWVGPGRTRQARTTITRGLPDNGVVDQPTWARLWTKR